MRRSGRVRRSGTCRYLPIDPNDVGRTYEAIIRVNSQSGKGGVAYLMQVEHHLDIPRGLQVDFAQKVQAIVDARGGELASDELLADVCEQYLDHVEPFELVRALRCRAKAEPTASRPSLLVGGDERIVEGEGNGPIDALVTRALPGARRRGARPRLLRARDGSGEDATPRAYVEADVDGDVVWGVGIHSSIVTASLRAVVNAVNRARALRAGPRRGGCGVRYLMVDATICAPEAAIRGMDRRAIPGRGLTRRCLDRTLCARCRLSRTYPHAQTSPP